MRLNLVTAPTVHALTVEEARIHLRLSASQGDTNELTRLICAAEERGEAATGRAYLTQTWELVLEDWPDADWIELPKAPLQSVTSVKYYDTAGVQQTWAATNYTVSAPAGPRAARGRIGLAYGMTWPSLYGQTIGNVTIRFVAGYGAAASSVPDLLKVAALLELGTLYANREGLLVMQGGVAVPMPMGVADIYRMYASPVTQRLA